MSKIGSTKNKILNLIATSNKTLSELSEELGLAPSTVSQHLQELLEVGAIVEVENEHIRKWKYYKLNPEFDYSAYGMGSPAILKAQNKPQTSVFFYAAIGICIVAVAAYVILSGSAPASVPASSVPTSSGQALQSSNATTYTPVMLTDPPIVPNGTSSLIIAYSSVSAHLKGSNSSAWVTSNTVGNVDLISLVNASEVIAGLSLPTNSIVNALKFDIKSANIMINGTVYNVTVPSNMVDAQVFGSERINSTTDLLLDLSPTVIAEYSNNSTVFVMLPAVKAVVVSHENESNVTASTNNSIGRKYKLNRWDNFSLSHAHANLSITGASLQVSNGTTNLEVTIDNNGNATADLTNVVIVGNQTPVVIYNGTCGVPPRGGSPIPLWCRLVVNSSANWTASGNWIVKSQGKMERPSLYGLGSLGTGSGGTGVGSGSIGAGSGGNFGVGSNTGPVISPGVSGNERFNFSTGVGYGFNSTIVSPSFVSREGGRIQNWSRMAIGFPSRFNLTTANALASNFTFNDTFLYHLMIPMPVGFFGRIGHFNGTFSANAFYQITPRISSFRGIDFVVEQNGTLELQNSGVAIPVGNGYQLKAGQSVTLSFSGTLSLPGDFKLSLVPGSKYRIDVTGQYGAQAAVNVTAT
jgi:hypothetical protein